MQSSIAMAIHMPRRPSGVMRSTARPRRMTQMLPRFRRLGTNVSPVPRRTGGSDGSAEKRLGEQFDAEYLGGKRANLRVRSQNAKDERTEDHHQTSSDGHQDCAHGNADISVAFRQLVISGAVASADERCRGGTDAVAWHVAEAFGGDGERIGRNRNGAERGNQHGGSNHGAVHRDFLYGNRHTDFECSFQNFRIKNRFPSGGDAAADCGHNRTRHP